MSDRIGTGGLPPLRFGTTGPLAPPPPAEAPRAPLAPPPPVGFQDQNATASQFGAVPASTAVPLPPGASAQSHADFVRESFRNLLAREPDEAAVASAAEALANGHPVEDFIKGIMESQERKNMESLGFTKLHAPGELPPLSSVPHLPLYDSVKLEATNLPEMVMDALRAAKELRPDIMQKMAKAENGPKNVKQEKQLAYELMTTTIGILRANGIDASRVVAYPDNAVGDPGRYGFDQLRIGNGPAIDIMGGDEGVCFIEQEAWSRPENLPENQRGLRE